jgi:hypothetical protein
MVAPAGLPHAGGYPRIVDMFTGARDAGAAPAGTDVAGPNSKSELCESVCHNMQ